METFKQLTSKRAGPLTGTARIPGDKSISHRALMLGSLAVGETIISGLLEGEDVFCTAEAMKALGAKVYKSDDGLWHTYGVGIGGLHEPSEVLDMGNSGTSTRLLIGLVGGHPITAFFTGDKSLVKRPMKRVITPLEMMGATFMAREGGRLPLAVKGSEQTLPIEYRLPVASAQVKSAVLLAGLSAPGITTVIEEQATRDHTENMLRHFGVPVETEEMEDGALAVHVTGQVELQPCAVDVPADISSAAFPIVAALLVEGSEIKLPNIGVNPRRTGLIEVLQEMGADITLGNQRVQAGEAVTDITVKYSGALKGIEVPAEIVPRMVDEFPVLAMAAACANGTTKMTGLAELRVKESDRLLLVAEGLKACGVEVEMGEDSLTVRGKGKPPKGGALIETHLDHRIGMSFLVLGCVSVEPVTIDDASPIATSFPGFVELMRDLGANIGEGDIEFFVEE
jgi:3-phosphoshikimate 1-carboxyvinyltransferase